MKHTGIKLLAMAAAFAVGLLSQARAVTWTFLENGANADLGTSSTFTSGGYSVTAYGFTSAGVGSDLFSKWTSGNPGETGLGMVTDAGNDHEIDSAHFVQLDSVIVPAAHIGSVGLGSIQTAEDAGIFGSNTWGVLGTQIGTVSANGSFSLAGWAGTYRFFGVTTVGTAREGNVLLTSLSATVQDGGTTSLLLGLGLIGLAMIRRRR